MMARLKSKLRRPRFLRGPSIGNPITAKRIETERLVLRPYTLNDVEPWFELQSDPEVIRQILWPQRNRKQSREHLIARTKHTKLLQSNDLLALGVEFDGQLIGDVTLHLRTVATENRSADVSWIINSQFKRRGFGLEATDAILKIAFEDLKATLVTATIKTDNLASVSLAKKRGFIYAAGVNHIDTYILTAHANAHQLQVEQSAL